jgi:hypothetical protein
MATVRFENMPLTSTRSVWRRQPDGSWMRIIDRPEVPRP